MSIKGTHSSRPFLAILSILLFLFIFSFPISAKGEEVQPVAVNESETTWAGSSAVPENHVFTGAATYNISIKVPPGRNKLAPNLSLKYNSYLGNGWIGVGWRLDMGFIKRSTKRGLDYSEDDYVFVKDGHSKELVSREDVWGTDYYGAKIKLISEYM